jgi:hypothetical protein
MKQKPIDLRQIIQERRRQEHVIAMQKMFMASTTRATINAPGGGRRDGWD